jgi:predicted nicotinamide N-methyase
MPPLRVRYQTVEVGPYDIHVKVLRDRNQFDDVDGEAASHGVSPEMWPVFGLVWDAGQELARRMVDHDVGHRRVLELGCGIAVASLVLRRRDLDVTATDHHPLAGAFLAHNAGLNAGGPIPFVRAAWSELTPELGLFDLLIGSDVLYEAQSVSALVDFVDSHAAPTAELMVIDPGRGHLGRFARAMGERGFVEQTRERVDGAGFSGHVLRAWRPVRG